MASAFVLMPFTAEFDEVYDGLIKPTLAEAGYAVARADAIVDQHNVMRDVIEGIGRASLVVAEITTPNPNVYYELGVAHALGRPTVLLTQSIESLPFDLKAYRVIAYTTHFAQVPEFRRKLGEVAAGALAGTVVFTNPVQDFLPSEMANDLAPSPEADHADTTAVEVDRDGVDAGTDNGDTGFLDAMVEVESGFEDLNEHLDLIGAATVEIGDQMTRRTEQIETLDLQVPGAIKRAQKIASAAARDLRAYAIRLDELVGPFGAAVNRLSTASWNVVSFIEAESDSEREQLRDIRDGLQGMHEAAVTSQTQLSEFRDSIDALRGVTRELDDASQAARRGLDRVLDVLQTIEAFASKTSDFAREKLGDDGHTQPAG